MSQQTPSSTPNMSIAQQWQWYNMQQAWQQQQYYQWYHQQQQQHIQQQMQQPMLQSSAHATVPCPNPVPSPPLQQKIQSQSVSHEAKKRNHNLMSKKGNQEKNNDTSDSKRMKVDYDIPEKYLIGHQTGTTPEEVEAWRAARRKNYPTEANIKQKQTTNNSETRTYVDEKPTQNEPQQPIREKNKQNDKNTCFKFINGRCTYGAKCRYEHDVNLKRERNLERRKAKEKTNHLTATGRPNGHDSLLRKLLLSDINKERKVILQCIRYLLVKKAQ